MTKAEAKKIWKAFSKSSDLSEEIAALLATAIRVMNMPTYLYRADDGERFTLQPSGTYTMDSSAMKPPYEYNEAVLRAQGFVTVKPKVIVAPTRYHVGCGDEGDAC